MPDNPTPRTARRRSRAALGVVGGLTALVLLLAGCGGSSGHQVPTTIPATPLSATPPATAPAGSVVPWGPIRALATDPGSRRVAVLSGDGRVVTWLSITDPLHPVQTGQVTLPAAATDLAGFAGPAVLAVGPTGLLRVSDSVQTTPINGTAISAVALPDGGVAVGTETGSVVILTPDFTVRKTITGLVRVDQLAQHAGVLMALDRAQSAVSLVNVDSGKLGDQQPAGNGAARLVVDKYGRFIVSNTRDNQVLTFSTSPFMNRVTFPVPGGPYAVDYDDNHDRVWVTETGTNTLVAFTLNTGAAVAAGSFPTVRQPNTMVVDPTSGTVYVGSADGGGLQVVGS